MSESVPAAPAQPEGPAAPAEQGITPGGYPFRRVLPTLRPTPADSTHCKCAERRRSQQPAPEDTA